MGFNWGKTLSILILTAFIFSTFSPGILLAAEEAGSKENIISTEPVSTPAIEEKSIQKESTGKVKITPIPTDAGTEKTTDPNLMTAAATSSTTTESPGPGEIKSPDSPLNSNAAYQTGLFTGSANYDYSIPVPPGTNGLTPEVKLSYNSMGASGRSTIVGLGWDLNLSYILRDVNYTPTNISDDKFKLVLNGSSHDLVYDVQSNSYKTKIDSGLMIKKLGGAPNRYNEYWEVKSKDGITYRLGYNMNAESKCESVTNPRAWGVRNYSKAWYLDEITDINNNKVYYTYQYNIDLSDIGAVYIQKIEYNNEKSRKIEFVYED